ncbi:MAG TPA: cupin domain-containing protein [Solirubrobacteraceae bacterium]|jgi:quercetin dioxygenase-like cupin family protein
MEIIRSRPQTTSGPPEWFTGSVFIDGITPGDTGSRLRAYRVHFSPSARTAWHTHPHGQVLHVTEGVGLVQRRGGPIEEIRPGDTVHIDPGEDHWHGAGTVHFMTHLALQEAGEDGVDAVWGEHVSDEEYAAAPDS